MIAAAPPLDDWQLVLLAIPLLLGFWSLVMAIASLAGGWHNLAKRFRREETTYRIREGGRTETYRWASLKMGPRFFPSNYGNCVTVTLGEDGIGLAVVPLFRPMHPPLVIPWSTIDDCKLDKELLIFDRTRIRVSKLASPLRIYGRAARAIQRYWTSEIASSPRE